MEVSRQETGKPSYDQLVVHGIISNVIKTRCLCRVDDVFDIAIDTSALLKSLLGNFIGNNANQEFLKVGTITIS